MKKIKILIADDHQILREGLVGCLLSKKDFKVIGEAVDGVEVIEMAGKLRPDIVIMDIGLPKLNGLKATKAILAKYPDIKILVLSAYDDEEYVNEFIKSGASGYLLKNNSSKEVIIAIEKILNGNIYIDSLLTQIILCQAVENIKSGNDNSAGNKKLTSREKQILSLVAEGKLNKEIADLLNISIKTVIVHREHIKAKLGITSVAKLTQYAIEKGYINIERN